MHNKLFLEESQALEALCFDGHMWTGGVVHEGAQ